MHILQAKGFKISIYALVMTSLIFNNFNLLSAASPAAVDSKPVASAVVSNGAAMLIPQTEDSTQEGVTPELPYTIIATKVVCVAEEYLPNWGATSPVDITATTAVDFVSASNGKCRLENNWDFQYGFGDKEGTTGVDKLTGDHIGEADGTDTSGLCPDPWCGPNTFTGSGYADWKTFGSTNTDGETYIVIEDLEDAPVIWVREVLREGYIPFTYPTAGAIEDNVTAELYCNSDVVNYDNYDQNDHTGSPSALNNYYCIAFNAPKPTTIVAHKVMCEAEVYLPNWGALGIPDITETTAEDYVAASNGHCWLEPNWDFQWGYGDKDDIWGVHKLPGDHIGEADGTDTTGQCPDPWCGHNTFTGENYEDWKTFGSTDANGIVSVMIADTQDADQIWVREVLQEGYLPFSYPPAAATEDDVTAELYCHTDTLNFDNYDFIDRPTGGETYHCVAFNVPIEPPDEPQGCCGEDTQITYLATTFTHPDISDATEISISYSEKESFKTVIDSETLTGIFPVDAQAPSDFKYANLVVTGKDGDTLRFNIQAQEGWHKIRSNTAFKVTIDGVAYTSIIHTSCSQDLYVGQVFGTYFTVAGLDGKNISTQCELPDTAITTSVNQSIDPTIGTTPTVSTIKAKAEKKQAPIQSYDTDNDGLTNIAEISIWKTDPTNPDTDGDGFTDGQEVMAGYNPNGPGKMFIAIDSDEDGLSDSDEETIWKTNKYNRDSDGDGYTDGQEVAAGYDPLGPGKLKK